MNVLIREMNCITTIVDLRRMGRRWRRHRNGNAVRNIKESPSIHFHKELKYLEYWFLCLTLDKSFSKTNKPFEICPVPSESYDLLVFNNED